jgi:hypothetical protein
LWAGPNSKRRKYNYRASFVQGNARKTKENSLDFLGFLWSNRDFSMGYAESKSKKSPHAETRLPDCAPLKIPDAMSLPASPARGPRHVPQERRKLSHISIYSKIMQALIVLAVGRGERRIGKGRTAAKEGVLPRLSRPSTSSGANQ